MKPANQRSTGGAAPQASDARELLWTSGWDSTFRLLAALLLEDATVRPHYVIDPGRASTAAELRAMERIRAAVAAQHPAAAARLLPTRHAHKDEIPGIGITERRFANLAARGALGSQYEWLARYAASVGLVDLELAVHCDDKAHAFLAGNVVPIRTRSTTVYRLKDGAAAGDLALFERFSFPVFDLSKRDMQRVATEKGFLEILELSWFCHTPLGDRPCGVCGPCFDAIREGVGHRLPFVSRLRNRIYRVVPWRKLAGKARQTFGPGGRRADDRPTHGTSSAAASNPPSAPAATPAGPASVHATGTRPLPHPDGRVH